MYMQLCGTFIMYMYCTYTYVGIYHYQFLVTLGTHAQRGLRQLSRVSVRLFVTTIRASNPYGFIRIFTFSITTVRMYGRHAPAYGSRNWRSKLIACRLESLKPYRSFGFHEKTQLALCSYKTRTNQVNSMTHSTSSFTGTEGRTMQF